MVRKAPFAPVKLLCQSALATICFLAGTSGAMAQSVVYAMDTLPTTEIPGGLTARGIITESGYFDSNPLLLTTKTQSLWGSITSPELLLTDKTPLSTVNLDTIFDSNNFNESNFSSNDVHSKLAATEQVERWSAGLHGNVDYDTTRTSELSNYDLQISPVRHLGYALTPDVGYNFLPTDKLDLAGTYGVSDYANSIFTSYRTYALAPTYSHDFDQENTGLFSIQAQRYSATTGLTNNIDTVGASVGWKRQFTPRILGDASIGYQETKQTTAYVPSTNWTPQYNFSGDLTYKDEKDTFTATTSRSEYPFGDGTEALLTQFMLNAKHDISETFSIGALGGYQTAEYQASAYGNLKSLETVGASLTYHLSEHLDLSTSYQYRDEDLVDTSGSAQDHTVLFSISYRPKAENL